MNSTIWLVENHYEQNNLVDKAFIVDNQRVIMTYSSPLSF
jgi:hypothetical protein